MEEETLSFDYSLYQINPRWPPRWRIVLKKCYNFSTSCHINSWQCIFYGLVILYILNRYTLWSHFRFGLEVHQYNVGNSVNDARIDTYWKILSDLYLMLCMPVYSILSIVTTPKFECLFSVTNSVLEEHTTRLNMETVSMIQTIRYYLKEDKMIIIGILLWCLTGQLYYES